MKFEIHCHSMYSKRLKVVWESVSTPAQIIREAKRKGLGAIALTDHRITTGWKEAREEAKKQGIIFIPGQEIESTMGHLLGLGLTEMVPNELSLLETIDRIHEQGAVAVAPHPFDIRGEGIRDGIKHADSAEIFNSMNVDRFSNVLAKRKITKAGKPAVVGSDAHTLDMIGSSVNVAPVHDLESVLRAIRTGKVTHETSYFTTQMMIDWITIRFSKSYGQVMKYIEDNYNPLKANLARVMLNKFMASRRNNRILFWKFLTRFSMLVSGGYSLIRFLAFY